MALPKLLHELKKGISEEKWDSLSRYRFIYVEQMTLDAKQRRELLREHNIEIKQQPLSKGVSGSSWSIHIKEKDHDLQTINFDLHLFFVSICCNFCTY